MNTLTIVNFVLVLAVIFYLVYKGWLYRLRFELKRSYPEGTLYVFYLWWYDKPLRFGQALIAWTFRDPHKHTRGYVRQAGSIHEYEQDA